MTATAIPEPSIHECPECHIYIKGDLTALAAHLNTWCYRRRRDALGTVTP